MNIVARVVCTLLTGLLLATTAWTDTGTEDAPEASSPRATAPHVDAKLQRQFAADGQAEYLIFFRQRADLAPAYDMGWLERGRFVVDALRRAADQSQPRVRDYLERANVRYRAFWIDNVIAVESSDLATFQGLQRYPEIAALRADPGATLVVPEASAPAEPLVGAIEPNIEHVNAPDVWAMGFRGEDLVVGGIDTGVRYTHEALVNQYRGNLGGDTFVHDHNWWDPMNGSPEPVDGNGHGTHTLGIAVGDDGGTNQIGMAPGARWIGCRGCSGVNCGAGALLACGQFMAAPWDLDHQNADPDLRPHVVNNSWGDCEREYDAFYRGTVDAWQAAGIVPVFSNGNAANCLHLPPPPCDTVGNPARFANVLGVGSTGTSNGQYAPHSNKGPTDDPWNDNPLGFPTIKPNVAAPGVNIRSATSSGDGAYTSNAGTSQSAPHVAGLVALLWQAAPCLQGDYVASATLIMDQATDIPIATQCGGEGPGDVPNNATGWGEIDALAIVTAGIAMCQGQGSIQGVVTRSDSSIPLENVEVRAVGLGTRTALTEADGSYMTQALPWTYEVRASMPGFHAETVAGVEVPEGGTVTVDFSLDPAPIADVSPASYDVEIPPGETGAETLEIGNLGEVELDWSVAATGAPNCGDVVEVPWLAVAPESGTTAPAGSVPVDLEIDATDLDEGGYNARLCVATDDPTAAMITVPISLTVARNLPRIDVTPASLSPVLGTGQTGSRELTVANAGGETLEWDAADELPMERLGAVGLRPQEHNLRAAVIDPAGDFGYFVAESTLVSRVAKVDLDTLARVGGIVLQDGEQLVRAAVIDPAGAFAYLGTATNPARVVKLNLETFQRVGRIQLAGGGGRINSAVIDPQGEFAYFGTANPGRVVKVDLETFEAVGSIPLVGDEAGYSAVIDPAGDFAYFAGFTEPALIAKIDLDTFERVGGIELDNGENGPHSAVIDPAGDFAYFGTASPGLVVKVDLETFERVGAIELNGGTRALLSAVIEPSGKRAYFGRAGSPGRVVEIDLVASEHVRTITLADGESNPSSAVIDPLDHTAYFGTVGVGRGRVVGVALSKTGCASPDWAAVAPSSGSVPGGGAEVVDVIFDATDLMPDVYEGALCLASNSPAPSGTVVPLELTVVLLPEPAFDPADLDFGDVEVGTMSAEQTATLHNTGDAAATGLAFEPPTGDFQADTSDCGSTLDVGASCEVGVTFAPTATGSAAATLNAISAEGPVATLELAGDGTSETEVFAAVGLQADPQPLDSDGNGVFEPGESVEIAPAWRHDGIEPRELEGTASDFTGPAGPSYALVAPDAGYGPLSPGETASCPATGSCYEMAIDPAGVERPATHLDATFEETLSDDTAHRWTLHVGDSFADVPRTSLFYTSIETLLHSGVTAGCGAGEEYCPGDANSRAQMPVFMLRALMGPDYTPPPCVEGDEPFGDVPFDSPFCPWIQDPADRGIVSGCGGDNYCPSDPVSRAQMAIFILRTLNGASYEPPACTDQFTDVPCPSLFADWIEDLAARGITGGCSATEYCPSDAVTRAQMAVFITRAFGFTLYGP